MGLEFLGRNHPMIYGRGSETTIFIASGKNLAIRTGDDRDMTFRPLRAMALLAMGNQTESKYLQDQKSRCDCPSDAFSPHA
jgi:hypothetical protein